jgi:hypothetical protein
MIVITEAGKKELREMCRAAAGQRPVVQRLVAGMYGRLQFAPDDSGDWTDDIVFEDADGVLLVIDRELHDGLDDLTLDCEDYQGARLLGFQRRQTGK